METPLSEVIDRYAILKLKMEGIDDYLTPDQVINEKPLLENELNLYHQAVEEFYQKGIDVHDEIQKLYEINARCREMESHIHRHMDRVLNREELEQIGRSAVMLRDFNTERIGIKNEVAKRYKITTKIIEVPLGEIVDRYNILRLKMDRIDNLTPDQIINEKPFLKREIERHGHAIEGFCQKCADIDNELIQKLYDIHAELWNIESDIRQGKENLLGLEEVGRRAIAVRRINRERINIKNIIAEKSKTGFKEVKIFIK